MTLEPAGNRGLVFLCPRLDESEISIYDIHQQGVSPWANLEKEIALCCYDSSSFP